MAITFTGATGFVNTTASSSSTTLDITGTQRFLAIALYVVGTQTASFTVGGVDIPDSVLRTTNFSGHRMYMFYATGPATGTGVTIALSLSGSAAHRWVAALYDGVDQTTSLDATAVSNQSTTGATSRTESITTVTTDAWTVLAGACTNGNTPSAGTGTTSRGNGVYLILGDSNGGQGAPGSKSMQFTMASSGWGDIMLALRPAAGAAATNTSNLLLLGVG